MPDSRLNINRLLNRGLIAFAVFLALPLSALCADSSNRWTLRSNALYWLTATPNGGADVSFGSHFSAGVALGYNAFKFPNHKNNRGEDANPKLLHWSLSAEGRYWFKSVFDGHFAGIQVLGGQYNAGGLRFPHFLNGYRYRGSAVGAGLVYGYQWRIAPNWGIELSAGVGYLLLNYDKYDCGSCGSRIKSARKNYVGPTKAALSIVYTLPADRRHADMTVPEFPSSTALPEADPVVAAIQQSAQELSTDSAACAAEVSARRCVTDTLRMTFRYPVDIAEFSPDFEGNRAELCRLDSVAALADSIIRVDIRGYASPEYTVMHNLALSEHRAISAAGYLARNYGFDSEMMIWTGYGEDWRGLVSLLDSDPMDYKEEIKSIISQKGITDGRKDALRNLKGGDAFNRLMQYVYPKLRRTVVEIIYIHNDIK